MFIMLNKGIMLPPMARACKEVVLNPGMLLSIQIDARNCLKIGR